MVDLRSVEQRCKAQAVGVLKRFDADFLSVIGEMFVDEIGKLCVPCGHG